MKKQTTMVPDGAGFSSQKETGKVTRRRFLWQGSATVIWGAARVNPGFAAPQTLPVPLGYSVISWPESAFEQAFETISALGYKGVQILPWVQDAYAGSKIPELKARLKKLNLVPTALSCRGVSLSPDHPEASPDKFREDADFFHNLGGKVLQVTDGGKPRSNYTADQIKSLGARMNELGRMANDSGLRLGYHPHFGTLGETREGLGSILEATDPRYVGLIADVAHLKLGGSDPAEVIRTYHQRLVMLHLKDLRRDTYDLAQQNLEASRRVRLRFCEVGHGILDFPGIVAALRDTGFKGWGIVELDRYEPPPGGPAEAAKMNRDSLRSLGFNI